MRITLRKVGNSVGVLIPKAILDAWGLGAGDSLEVDTRGVRPITPAQGAGSAQDRLDRLKRRLGVEILARFRPEAIRRHSLANLERWRSNGHWPPVYEEWHGLLVSGDDIALMRALSAPDEQSNRLRQSPPYVGLLPREVVRALNAEADEEIPA